MLLLTNEIDFLLVSTVFNSDALQNEIAIVVTSCIVNMSICK
jgi:hypothetical protein